MGLCECGCGGKIKDEKRFVKGHNLTCLSKEEREKGRLTKVKIKISKNFLIGNYYHKKLTLDEIANKLGCCYATIRKNMIRYNLKRRENSDYEAYNKGKTYEETFGNEEAKRLKEVLRINNVGKKLSEDHKISIGNGLKKAYDEGRKKGKKGKEHPGYGKENKWGHHTIEAKNNIGISSSERMKERWENNPEFRDKMLKKLKFWRENNISPVKDTTIEVKLQEYLKQLGIEFFTHIYMKEIEHRYQCDIIVPSRNLVIEADGDYWHGNPEMYSKKELSEKQNKQKEKDNLRTKELIEKGYNVLRLWENKIRKMSLEDFKEEIEKYN